MAFSFVQEMNFEIKEGNECVVRNYRELQVIYHISIPSEFAWTISRFLFHAQFNNFAVDSTNQRIAVTV